VTAGTRKRVSVSHAIALAEHGVRVAPTVQERQVDDAYARFFKGTSNDADRRRIVEELVSGKGASDAAS